MTRKSLLLGTMLAVAAGGMHAALSEPAPGELRVAQAPTEKDKEKQQHPGAATPGHPGAAPTQQHPGAAGTPPAAPNAPSSQQHPGTPPAAQNNVPGTPHPGTPGTPPAAQNNVPGTHPGTPGTPPAAQNNVPGTHPGTPGTPPAAQNNVPGTPHPGTPGTPPAAQNNVPGSAHPGTPGTPPAAQNNAPGTQRPGTPGTPPAAQNNVPGTQRPGTPGTPAAAQNAPGMQRPATAANAPIDPKTQPHGLDQVKSERKEVHEGNRTVITEGNRTIVQEGGHQVIRHDPSDRFRVNAKDVNVEHRGNATVTTVLQPGGFRIVTEVDDSGRLLRRIRRDAAGREVILIDDTRFEPRGPGFAGFVLDLRPPVIRIAPTLYIRDVAGATAADISLTLMAPPVEAIERRYSLDEILYNEPLRARMPRVDIDTVNFATGSWEIGPDQSDRLAFVAQGMLGALKRNPNEMFLIEGYTDAVGNDVDNLSLSDHRAESVAEMLTSQFGVPAENLTTQGYGKEFLKVPTQAAERANRRVAVRRITPLLGGSQS